MASESDQIQKLYEYSEKLDAAGSNANKVILNRKQEDLIYTPTAQGLVPGDTGRHQRANQSQESGSSTHSSLL